MESDDTLCHTFPQPCKALFPHPRNALFLPCCSMAFRLVIARSSLPRPCRASLHPCYPSSIHQLWCGFGGVHGTESLRNSGESQRFLFRCQMSNPRAIREMIAQLGHIRCEIFFLDHVEHHCIHVIHPVSTNLNFVSGNVCPSGRLKGLVVPWAVCRLNMYPSWRKLSLPPQSYRKS